MPTVLVTSANRGIGLEFVRQYAADGWQVLAACRDPQKAPALGGLSGAVETLRMDVTDAASVEAAAAASRSPVDLLINSAGIIGDTHDGPGAVDYATWAAVMDVNAFGPVRVLDAFADRIAASDRRLAVTITSGMGSLADTASGGAMMYRTSKAAVNMAMRARSFALADRGITVIVMNPGWVKTDMGGPNASITVDQSVSGLRRVIGGLTPEQTGSFLNHTGEVYAW